MGAASSKHDRKSIPSRPAETRRTAPVPPESADLNLRILGCLAPYVRDHFGDDALARIASSANLDPTDLGASTRWASVEQVETVLAGIRDLIGSEKKFEAACAYQYGESFGSLILGLLSPAQSYRFAAEMFPVASRISKLRYERVTRNHVRMHYRTRKPESRLLCLTRLSTMRVHPTLWGLPPARLTELACVSRGDASCIYDVRIYEHRRFFPPILGLISGALVAGSLMVAELLNPAALVALPLLGAAIGSMYELHRTRRVNLAMADDAGRRLQELAREEADAARLDLLELHAREREWTRLMEEQVAERTASLQGVASRVRSFRERMQATIRGFGHDLRHPLHTLRVEGELLREDAEALSPDVRDLVEDHDEAIKRIDHLLDDLMAVTTSDLALVTLEPQRLELGPLSDRLRRRARALAYGKDLDVNVFSTADAPPTIVVDPMVFDRVLDNLLTNAVKYTERGSIVVEITGAAGFLTIKVSDTGRGIDDESIERIFHPGGSDASQRAAHSYGVGLSVVVQLLAQCGGRLEVMSKPGAGTTFWVHLPVTPATAAAARTPTDGPAVLTIRNSQTPSTS